MIIGQNKCRQTNQQPTHIRLSYQFQVAFYANCSCTKSSRASPGECGGSCPTQIMISLTITTLGIIINFSGFAAHAYIYQRIVSEVDRTFCQGIRSCLVRMLGTLPAPLLFGWVIDMFCITWRMSDDGTTGNCWIYDIDRFVFNVLCFAGFIMIHQLCYFAL